MKAINEIMKHFNPKPEKLSGICPVCGSNILRQLSNCYPVMGYPGDSFSLYADKDELDYGRWECCNHHTFEVEPEGYDKIGQEFYGIKITK